MAEIVAGNIPYERQSEPMSSRMCGPAALCMVYRSFGLDCSQAEVAAKVVRPGPSGNAGARTYLLAQDALARGLSAIVFRARNPVHTLRACQNRPLRLILNHRLHLESPTGHFTVLVRVGEEHVVVHDPQIGPDTRILQSDLLKLWRPLGGSSEISGNVLVALSKQREPAAPCAKCGTAIPDMLVCPGCRKLIPLQPTAILGCMNGACSERNWEVLFCPYCDISVVDTSGKTLGSALAGTQAETEDDPMKLKPLSQEIDQFIAILLGTTNGQPVPGLEHLITQIRGLQKGMLEFQKKEAAEQRRKAAEPPPPPPPVPPPEPAGVKPPPRPRVDWNAFGLDLLKELGLLGEEPLLKRAAVSERAGPQLTPRTSEITEFLKKKGMWK